MGTPPDSDRESRPIKSLPKREVSGESYTGTITPKEEAEGFRFKDLPASLVNGGYLYRQRAAEIILSCTDEAKVTKFAALNRYEPNRADPLPPAPPPKEEHIERFACPSSSSASDNEDSLSSSNAKKRKSVRSIDVPPSSSSSRLIIPRHRIPYSSYPSTSLRHRFKLKYKLHRFRREPDQPKKPPKRPSKAEKRARALRGLKATTQRKRNEVPSAPFEFTVESPIANGLEKLRKQMEGLQVGKETPPIMQKISRRKKATMNNVHHRENYVPSRTPSEGVKKEESKENCGLFGGEWTCLFCEYELLYGEQPLMLRACRNRKKQVQRRRKKGEAAPEKEKNERCSCHQENHHHENFEPVFDAMKKDKVNQSAIVKYITTGGKLDPPIPNNK